MEIGKLIAWMIYTAIENYKQKIESPYSNGEWLNWIQCIRLAKMDLWKEYKFE